MHLLSVRGFYFYFMQHKNINFIQIKKHDETLTPVLLRYYLIIINN